MVAFMKSIQKNACVVLMILAAGFCGGCRMMPRGIQGAERQARIARYRQEAERLRGLSLVNEVALEKESREALLSMIGKTSY